MKIYRCASCGDEMFERRAVCRRCRGESFVEEEAGEPQVLVSAMLTVTPAGFEDAYEIVVGSLGRTRAIYRKV